ncbi:MAG: hypothetical protein ACK5Q8_09670 [Phycisphaerales bacterium]
MSLAQIAQNKKQQARTAFINAAWSEEPPERLAELANEAGMELAAADTILARIADIRTDMDVADSVMRLRRAASQAKAHSDAVGAKAQAAIDKLEAEAETVAREADAARRELGDAESAALRVLSVYEEGLIPVVRLPKEVSAMLERRALEGKVNQAHAVVIAATNKRNSLREDVQRREREMQYLPISRDRKEQEARLHGEIERAKAALAAAEARLSDAERAHAKARNAL